MDPISAVLNIGETVIDKLFPDATEKEKARLELLKLQQDGQFRELEAQFSAINTEAQSSDPWTSRARPSFLYVMYALILFAIPMGFLAAFHPEQAARVSAGMQAWLAAIPEDLWWLMGAGYLGYTGARSWDKRNQTGGAG